MDNSSVSNMGQTWSQSNDITHCCKAQDEEKDYLFVEVYNPFQSLIKPLPLLKRNRSCNDLTSSEVFV